LEAGGLIRGCWLSCFLGRPASLTCRHLPSSCNFLTIHFSLGVPIPQISFLFNKNSNHSGVDPHHYDLIEENLAPERLYSTYILVVLVACSMIILWELRNVSLVLKILYGSARALKSLQGHTTDLIISVIFILITARDWIESPEIHTL
jgi:hypothetical protein